MDKSRLVKLNLCSEEDLDSRNLTTERSFFTLV